MNVNLTNATDSPKATKILGDVGEVSVESTEVGEAEEGFFSKLASFILGESKSSKVSTDTEVDAGQVAVSKGDDTVDTLLNSELLSEVSAEDGDSEGIDSKPQAEQLTKSADGLKESATTDKLLEQASKKEFDSSKVMSEGDEILAKLNEATESLKTKHGNNLPAPDEKADKLQQFTEPKADTISHNTVQGTESVKQDTSQQSDPIAKASSEPPTTATNGFEPSKPTEPSKGQPLTEVNKDNGDEKIVWRSSQHSAEAPHEQQLHDVAVDKATIQRQASEATKDSRLKAHEVKPEHMATAEHQTQDKQKLSAEELLHTISANQAVNVATQKDTEDTAIDPRQLMKNVRSSEVPKQVQQPQNFAAHVAQPSVDLKAEVAKQTIPADILPQMPLQAKQDLTAEQLAHNLQHHTKVQQMSLAQSVQQALSQQQLSQVVADKAAIQAPLQSQDVTPAQLQHLAALAATPAVVNNVHQQMGNHAALRTALAAKSVDGALDGQAVREGKDAAGLANQIAGAAGQQGTSATNSLRAESAQTVNSPLQLTRDNVSDQMAEKVNMMMSKNLKNIDIRLDPPELGRMQIRLHMNGEGAGVHFTVANHHARDAIEQSLPRLREMLSQQGVQLGDTSVQQQSSGQQQRYTASGDGGFSQGGNGENGMLEGENLEAGVNLDVNVTSKGDGISYYA